MPDDEDERPISTSPVPAPPGPVGRRPTMEDVARAAGVSRALVSIVYRGVEGASDQTRRKVLAAGEQIGYRRNSLASRLASKAVGSIGVLLFDMRNDLTADVFAGIQEEADGRGIGVVVGISDPTGERDARTVNELLDARVDALVMISSTMTGSQVRELGRSIPVVSVTRDIRGVDSVVADEALAGRLMVGHLVARGHRRIAHLAPPWRPSDRVEAYQAAMREAGLDPWVETISYDFEDTRDVARGLLGRSRRPDAIYANNDNAAYAVLEAAADLGLQVPQDLAVVGFDNLRASALHSISLTSIDQRPQELGRIAVRTALAHAGDPGARPVRHVLSPELVVRGSSGV